MRGVDLEALACLGPRGHQWELRDSTMNASPELNGCPEETYVCEECRSLKVEVTSWDGVVRHRRYESGELYIGMARKLEENPALRRRAYRREIMKQRYRKANR